MELRGTGKDAMDASFKMIIAIAAAAAVLAITPPTVAALEIGVNYGRVANNLPPPAQVAALVTRERIARLKIFDADPQVQQAFVDAGAAARLVITVPNDAIAAVAAAGGGGAAAWFDAHARPFLPYIDAILVGNEVLKFSPVLGPSLVPAMRNLHRILAVAAPDGAGYSLVKVSSPHAMDILERGSSSPPSAGIFVRRHTRVLAAMLAFLDETGSFFMINAYPYFAYREDKGVTLPVEYALLQDGAPVYTDAVSQLRYQNVLDAMTDAVYSAMAKLDAGAGGRVGIVVGETGWPTAGGFGATKRNAQMFTSNLIHRASQGLGTPLRPDFAMQAFAFALFNENLKHNLMEQHFGMFYPNMTEVYPVSFF